MSSVLLDHPPVVPSRVHGTSSAITLLGMLFPLHHPRPPSSSSSASPPDPPHPPLAPFHFLSFSLSPDGQPPVSRAPPSSPSPYGSDELSTCSSSSSSTPFPPPPLRQLPFPALLVPSLLCYTIDILLKFEPQTHCVPPADK